MSNNLVTSFVALGESKFPSVKLSPNPLQADKLISPHQVQVKRSTLAEIKKFVSLTYRASRQSTYQDKIQPQDVEIHSAKTPNDSVLMAYDFHLDSHGKAKLIEVNTNASGYLMASLLYEVMKFPNEFGDPFKQIESAFKSEWQSTGSNSTPHVAIVDETLAQQKMLPEFYMYRDLFESWGWTAQIEEFQNFKWKKNELVNSEGKPVDFVYNRLTDFFLSRPESVDLRKAYLSGKVIFSPQPREYQLLADKQRLVEWSRESFWSDFLAQPADIRLIQDILLKSYVPSDFKNLDEVWDRRKTFFFKPLRMYGGKSAFKGANISRVAFDRIFSDDKSMIQEFCPAPKFTDDKGVEWKYDLRFFVYRDEIQLGVARAYQGQVTNFGVVGGGFCPIKFVDL